MRYLLIAALLASSCVKAAKFTIVMSDDVKLDKDQILVCPYIKKYNVLRCMTPEEFQVRSQAAE